MAGRRGGVSVTYSGCTHWVARRQEWDHGGGCRGLSSSVLSRVAAVQIAAGNCVTILSIILIVMYRRSDGKTTTTTCRTRSRMRKIVGFVTEKRKFAEFPLLLERFVISCRNFASSYER